MGRVDKELGRGRVPETERREARHRYLDSCVSPVAIVDGFAADLDDENGNSILVICWRTKHGPCIALVALIELSIENVRI